MLQNVQGIVVTSYEELGHGSLEFAPILQFLTKSKAKYVDVYSASSRSASNAILLPVSRR